MVIFVYFLSGTCINNTSVMMFKKGSFEIGGDVYPVAIKASLLSRYLLLASTFLNYLFGFSQCIVSSKLFTVILQRSFYPKYTVHLM